MLAQIEPSQRPQAERAQIYWDTTFGLLWRFESVRNIKHTVVGHQDRHALSEMVLSALELLRFSTSIRLGAVCGVAEVLLGLSILVGTQEVETPAYKC